MPAGLTDAVAISAGDQHSVALKRDGTVVARGAFDYSANGEEHAVPTYVPAGLSEVVAIGAGLFHDIAVSGKAPSSAGVRTSSATPTPN